MATGTAGKNILVFFTDDHAQWALPAYGNRAIAAPALDALARRGTVFDNAMTATPVCSPARASFLSGLYPSQHGVHDFLLSAPRFDDKAWLEGVPTLPERLSGAGYECGLVGKWHVGRDWRGQPGFSHWFALNGEYPIHHAGENGFSRDGVIERERGNLTDIITREAIAFLRQPRQKPFFLFVGHYATHSPWQDQPERLVERYRGHDFSEIPAGLPAPGLINVELADADPARRQEARAQYYAAVSHIDESVGAILDTLSDQGLGEETLIVYTADHGLCLGQHGVWGKGNATRPQNLLEPSIRIPMLLAGPGVAAGRRRGEFFDHADLNATLCAFAGLEPDTHGSPGREGLGLLSGAGRPGWREVQFGEYGDLRMARSATHKLLIFKDGRKSLHSVSPGDDEVLDIIGAPGMAEVAAGLEAALHRFFAAHSRPAASGPAALAPMTYNRNQAWHPFVPPGAKP
jgi:arylsulfatase A-like enzyme